VTIFAAVVH